MTKVPACCPHTECGLPTQSRVDPQWWASSACSIPTGLSAGRPFGVGPTRALNFRPVFEPTLNCPCCGYTVGIVGTLSVYCGHIGKTVNFCRHTKNAVGLLQEHMAHCGKLLNSYRGHALLVLNKSQN